MIQPFYHYTLTPLFEEEDVIGDDETCLATLKNNIITVRAEYMAALGTVNSMDQIFLDIQNEMRKKKMVGQNIFCDIDSVLECKFNLKGLYCDVGPYMLQTKNNIKMYFLHVTWNNMEFNNIEIRERVEEF